jgi:putative DNA primase/helicase
MTMWITRENRPKDMCTKITNVTPAPPGTPCPFFLSFLDTIFARDQDLIAFIRRVLGYCLTGFTDEHVLFFGYGTGRNGKGTLLNLILYVLGSYATVAPLEMFMLPPRGTNRSTDDLAFLRGARMVVASEINPGARWDETRIKALTGGDPITCRHLYGRYFTYTPQFKLFIYGNNKPSLLQADEAMRSRFTLIPFKVFIPEDKRDRRLPEKLATEAPAILAWILDGAVQWMNCGLQPPPSVRTATADYLETSDAFAAWMQECTEFDSNRHEYKSAAYESWTKWCEKNGERPGSIIAFGRRMEKAGILPGRIGGSGSRTWSGIRIISDEQKTQEAEM